MPTSTFPRLRAALRGHLLGLVVGELGAGHACPEIGDHGGGDDLQAEEAGEDRFRPIILTSLTTFVGLLPIMSETSVQAQFLIPMVTSLSFGVLFATAAPTALASLRLCGRNSWPARPPRIPRWRRIRM